MKKDRNDSGLKAQNAKLAKDLAQSLRKRAELKDKNEKLKKSLTHGLNMLKKQAMQSSISDETRESIERLKEDLKESGKIVGRAEARFLVDAYYDMQEDRKRDDNQLRTLIEGEEPFLIMNWLAAQSTMLEKLLAKSLDDYSNSHPLGVWARSVVGIGPIISAGLLCHIDIKKAPTVGHIWAFCGLDPTRKWEKGQKRPHNAALKRLSFLIGESFVKVSANVNDVYGKVYIKRKIYEIEKNELGEYATQAAERMEHVGKDTEAYSWYSGRLTVEHARAIYAAPSEKRLGMAKELAGVLDSGVQMLPPGHIHMRAKRVAVKLFLAAYHEVGFFLKYGRMPPKPYPFALLTGHSHYVGPPNEYLVPGLTEAKKKQWSEQENEFSREIRESGLNV